MKKRSLVVAVAVLLVGAAVVGFYLSNLWRQPHGFLGLQVGMPKSEAFALFPQLSSAKVLPLLGAYETTIEIEGQLAACELHFAHDQTFSALLCNITFDSQSEALDTRESLLADFNEHYELSGNRPLVRSEQGIEIGKIWGWHDWKNRAYVRLETEQELVLSTEGRPFVEAIPTLAVMYAW